MEIIQHLLGACTDNHVHFDLTDLLYMGGGFMGLYSVKYYLQGMLILTKNYFKKSKI